MSDIFREVDDDYRQEQLLRFWHQHARTIIVGLILAIVVAGGIGLWRSHDEHQREMETAALGRAIDEATAAGQSGSAPDAAKFDAVLGQLSKGRLIDAEFASAHLHAASGDTAGAIALYKKIAADSSTSRPEQGLAEISALYLQLDTGTPPDPRPLEELAAPDSPWHGSAMEIQALVKLKAGDLAGAREIWTELARDPHTPDAMKARASQFGGVPAPAQPTPAQPTPAQPTPAQPTPAQPTPAQPTPEGTP